jgi:chitinase
LLSKNIKILIGSIIGIILAIGISLGIYFGVKKVNDNKNNSGGGGKRVVGYYQQTATVNCSGIKSMTPDQIPAQYYTHLIYGFAPGIDNNTFEFKSAGSFEESRYKLFNENKKKNSNLLTGISIGGDLLSVSPMSNAIKDENRNKFIVSCVNFAYKYNFDHIDIDFEYPNDQSRGGSSSDPDNFVKFIKELRTEINKKSPKLLLSVALAGGPFWGVGYKVNEIFDYVDFFNIMAYNVQGSWEHVTSCSSPLVSVNPATNDSVTNAVEYFTNNFQLNPLKFNLGISFFGVSYKLQDSKQNGMTAPITSDSGLQGTCSLQDGYLAYFEIEKLNVNANIKTNNIAECNYFTINNIDWVAYDDTNTFGKKIDYLNQKNLGGTSVWGMDSDDPSNFKLTKYVSERIK